ncbi:GlxA family transcriptional regulator [Chromobacterium sp. IIBBL 290-4]|uniref:GlxA family transcriptional regulator n=1 Tax=Chromobacterium sp. IIBBL 290-4 TaxID=2953890 RepID=UPI0020B83B4D|nr:helix-turn-helix domain-containing protein [Chromobacterium sp. IIBBL 290-4]UTH74402.1 helix-turn-helix domain-containing protein [Chromobacterium sp. IIBBL 290-4]
MQNIAVLAFEGISPFHLSVPCLVLGEQGADREVALTVCAERPGRVRTSAGFDLVVEHGLEGLRQASVVIVPSWPSPAQPAGEAVLQALREASAAGAQLVGLCLGACVLAEAGLLDGRRATTHWAYADDFARRYPQVALDPDVLYVEDGDVLTSAGTAAAIDCCLHMLRRRKGNEWANQVARRLVVAPHRQGGQAQFIDQPLPQTGQDSRLGALLDRVRASLQAEHTLDGLAQSMAMSRRTFSRHFHALTGCTLGEWLAHERLAHSQRLLESTNLSMDEVAERAGLGSAVTMRRLYRQRLGVSPAAWRLAFRGG